MDYETGKWYGWNGGECHVHPETVVEVCWHDGVDARQDTGKAKDYVWDEGYLMSKAFRVITQYVEPREFWISTATMKAYASLSGFMMWEGEHVDYIKVTEDLK